MSFKVKRWATLRSVNLQERYPNLYPYEDPGQGGITTYGRAYPWAGYIIVCCYDWSQNSKAVWLLYDPATDTVVSINDGPDGGWGKTSAFYGNQTYYAQWDNRFLLGYPVDHGGYGSGTFWGWDQSLNFWKADFNPNGRSYCYSSSRVGQRDGLPSVMVFTRWQEAGQYYYEWGTVPFGGEYEVLKTVHPGETGFYIPFLDGNRYELRDLGGGYYQGRILSNDVNRTVVWNHIPMQDDYEDIVCEGAFGSYIASDPDAATFLPAPSLDVYMQVRLSDGQGGYLPAYWALASAPLTALAKPWETAWHYREQLEGLTLDEYDLDGTHHGVASMPCSSHEAITLAGGWYYGLDTNQSPLRFTVYVLDPSQPAGRAASTPRAPASGVLGWVGEYAIDTDKRLRHILPLPDDRAPDGGTVYPPQERGDGYLVGSKELFKGSGVKYTYERDISVDLSSYPTGDEDFRFPGLTGDKYAGFWGPFAGPGPTYLGWMPDPMWGMLTPALQSCTRFLGVPTENLAAVEPAPTHQLDSADVVANTSWAAPTSTGYNVRYQLQSALDGTALVYTSSWWNIGSMPTWQAKVGTIAGKAWTTLVDFAEVDPPDLGQTNWTVWSATPIPKCRVLPAGGWLVGATLYFDPWDEDNWEWVPGARTATFKYKDGTDSGRGWVPARPGWNGPLNNDTHEPILLTAYDEWTAGRSLYGPDALLVFDHEGAFVDCLNSPVLYPPDGREVMVTAERVPRLIYRIYRHGTYSDFGEYEGQYIRRSADEEVQAPLYAVYQLLDRRGAISPGAGTFEGMIDMTVVGDYSPKPAGWRWDTVAKGLYDWQYPRSMWAPPGGSYVRSGLGGRTITIMSPRAGQGRSGVKGVGRRA